VFLISSPHPHDGKTTVAANLAIVMAQTERRVLLVDADLRNPSLHRLFQVEPYHGLSELLLTGTYAQSIEVGDDKLSLVTAGEQPPNPSELLESKRMQRFIAFAREHYDIIIIDSPPILAVSDALVLSPWVDGILMVLRAGATPYNHARRAIASFLTLQADPLAQDDQETDTRTDPTGLGLVMNFLDPREGDAYGYYGYHNYYYHRHEQSDKG
jgi:capsular exopolysaccharide synthesis family protein